MAKKTADDLLGKLEGALPETPKEHEKERPTLSPTEALMVEYAGVHAAAKICDDRKKIAGDELKSHLWDQFLEAWFEAGSKPSNPKVQTLVGKRVDCSAIFQVRATFKVQAPEDHSSARGAVLEALRNVGFEDDIADDIFDENIEIEIETGLRPFNELVQGKWVTGKGGKEFIEATDVERSAAQKLLALVTNADKAKPLTNEERAVVLHKQTRYIVKAGFMERAATYCDSVDELRKLLTVIKPGEALSHVKFAATESEENRCQRIVEHFCELVGVDFAEVKAAA